MGDIARFALLSAIYPTLIAATSVMLLLPRAEDLMLGFLLGAMVTSVTLGLVIVFALEGTGAVKTTRHTVSPAVDLAIAGLIALAAAALAKARTSAHARDDRRVIQARTRSHRSGSRRCEPATPGRRSSSVSVLSFPGVWYLAALDRLTKLPACRRSWASSAYCVEITRRQPPVPADTHQKPIWLVQVRLGPDAPLPLQGAYADQMAEQDYRVGQIVEGVEQAGISDDTVIAFTSDNALAALIEPGFAPAAVG